MPRFFFDFSDGENVLTDTVGKEFVSEDAVIATAIPVLKQSSEFAIDLIRSRLYRMSIRNEAGVTIFEAAMQLGAKVFH